MNAEEYQKKRERRLLVLAWSFSLLFLFVAFLIYRAFPPTTVTFMDVGQGDACLISAGDGGNVLIDGGLQDQGEEMLTYFALQNVNHLDAIFVSHFHQDHVAGILELLRKDFPVGQLLISEHPSYTDLEEELLELAGQKQIPIRRVREDEELFFGEARYRVISQEAFTSENLLNNMSMVLRMDYGEASFLFTGDLERGGSRRLLERKGEILDVDLLKVPHHGGVSSVREELIQAVTPQWSVISVGQDNSYGEPHDDMLLDLMEEETGILRTDRDGTIVVTLGKNGIRNITWGRSVRE